MKVIYIGPHDGVEVPEVNYLEAERDKPVDVPDHIALKLLEQREAWAKAPEGKVKP